MLTNNLKKGALVRLHNGWEAEIFDNKKGNIRLAKVYGIETELGSVYAHDIEGTIASIGTGSPIIEKIELTNKQVDCAALNTALFG